MRRFAPHTAVRQVTDVPTLQGVEQPATTINEWQTQIAQMPVVSVTGVQVETTEKGLRILLESVEPLTEPSLSIVGNALIADISGAVLALPEGDPFIASNSAEGIALVSISSLSGDRIRIAITGENAPPGAEVGLKPLFWY